MYTKKLITYTYMHGNLCIRYSYYPECPPERDRIRKLSVSSWWARTNMYSPLQELEMKLLQYRENILSHLLYSCICLQRYMSSAVYVINCMSSAVYVIN